MAIVVREGVELVNKTLGMDPAQGMRADLELTGIIADDHRCGQQIMGLDTAPQRRLGGDQHRIGAHLEFGNAELVEMGMKPVDRRNSGRDARPGGRSHEPRARVRAYRRAPRH